MDSFNQVKNPLLKTEGNSLKQKKKSLIKDVPIGIYSQELTFPITKDVDLLSQLFFQFDITMAPSALNFNADFLAFKLLSNIYFETSQRHNLMHLKPHYQIYKYEQTSSTGLYDQISKCSNMPSTFNMVIAPAVVTSGSCRLKIPLFLFFSIAEEKSLNENFLSVRNMEDLQLRVRTATQSNIGMIDSALTLLSITGLRIALITESYNKEFSQRDQFDYGLSSIPVAPSIKNSYNVFYEDTVSLLAGSTSATILLRCPYPCMNLLGTIMFQNTRTAINSYSIKVKNTYIVGGEGDYAIDADTSFDLSNPQVAFNDVEYLEHFFNRKNEVRSNTGLITFSSEDSFYPCYLTVNYNALTADSNLYVFEEFITSYDVNQYRKIVENDTSSYLQKPNSVLSA